MNAPATPAVSSAARLDRGARRDGLLDAAASLVAQAGIEAVSMDSVAVRAGVSRPLVYKHFTDRNEIIAGLFTREVSRLDERVARAIAPAADFETVVRTSIRVWLAEVSARGAILGALMRSDGIDERIRSRHRAREAGVYRFYARLAAAEFGLADDDALAAIHTVMSGLEGLQAFWREHRGPGARQHLEDVYVALVIGGLSELAARSRASMTSSADATASP
jgi:AcrR family transcriptional regulator